MNKINFILPGLYELSDLNFNFLNLFFKHREYFLDNVNISAVYGNFQFCIWDGGRIFSNYKHTDAETIEKIKNIYNKDFNVPVRLVCTNTELNEYDCYDRFGNTILTLCENNMNEIVVNSPILEKYVRENYPKYSFISSTTKCLNKENFKEELNKDYKMICLDYNLNHNFDLLDNLSIEEKDKCEFLINAICPPGCPNRKEHYKLNSLYHLNYCKKYHIDCGIKDNTLSNQKITNNISPEEILNIYSKKGFKYFKIEGRTLSKIENACNYVKYMIKPEYQLYVLTQFINP